jgi:hypothetical protein
LRLRGRLSRRLIRGFGVTPIGFGVTLIGFGVGFGVGFGGRFHEGNLRMNGRDWRHRLVALSHAFRAFMPSSLQDALHRVQTCAKAQSQPSKEQEEKKRKKGTFLQILERRSKGLQPSSVEIRKKRKS